MLDFSRNSDFRLNDNGEIDQINYNNQIRDTIQNLPADQVVQVYKAMKAYDDLLYHEKNAITYKLKPGNEKLTSVSRLSLLLFCAEMLVQTSNRDIQSA